MPLDFYLHTKTEKDSKIKIRKHLEQKETCNRIKELMKETILLKPDEEMMQLEEIKRSVCRMRF